MCRNIRPLYNLEPPANSDEVRAAALQYVRKVSGYTRPSRVNASAFEQAVEEIAKITNELLETLETSASPRRREELAEKARARFERSRPAAGDRPAATG